MNFKKIILIAIIFFLKIEKSDGASQSLKYINVIADDSLHYPLTEVMNSFIKNSQLIMNVRFVNDNFYKTLVYDDKINIFITKSTNKTYIEKNFTLKSNRSLGKTNYCICGHNKQSIANNNKELLLKDIKNSKFRVITGNENSSFELQELNNIEKIEKFDSAMLAIKNLNFNQDNLGIFLQPMCISEKTLKILHTIDISDEILNNIKNTKIEYRIFIVNYLNNNIESFLSFLLNFENINEILRKYGIIKNTKQFS